MGGHGSMVDPELPSEIVQRSAGFIPGHYGAKLGRGQSVLDFGPWGWSGAGRGGGVGTVVVPTAGLGGGV
jgi:hypothetical protein